MDNACPRNSFLISHRILQPGMKFVSGDSIVDGFPMESDGPAIELKGGVELIRDKVRIGIEFGTTSVKMKKPIDEDFVNRYITPPDALGGDYGDKGSCLVECIWLGGFYSDSVSNVSEDGCRSKLEKTNISYQNCSATYCPSGWGGEEQVSGTTINDFTDPLVYTLENDEGQKIQYTVTVEEGL